MDHEHETGAKRRRESTPPWQGNDGEHGNDSEQFDREQLAGEGWGAYPAPLTHEHFELVLQELPSGAKLALQTCLSSWRVRAARVPSRFVLALRVRVPRDTKAARIRLEIHILSRMRAPA